ncbi:hypothetical protein ABIA32_004648 [Streptacidiphilus sp. MAP12-20]
MTCPAATAWPTATFASTGSKVVRSGGEPEPASSTETTGLPAISPT